MRVLRPQPHGVAKSLRILQRAQQHVGIENRCIGLRKADTAGLGQLRHFGQCFSFQANCQGAERIDMRLIQFLGAVFKHLDQTGLIQHRIGVRWADQTGNAALQCRLHFRLQRGHVFVAGFTQAHRQVDQARRDHQATGVDYPVGDEACRSHTDTGDLAGHDVYIMERIDAVGRIDQVAVFNVQIHFLSFYHPVPRCRGSGCSHRQLVASLRAFFAICSPKCSSPPCGLRCQTLPAARSPPGCRRPLPTRFPRRGSSAPDASRWRPALPAPGVRWSGHSS